MSDDTEPESGTAEPETGDSITGDYDKPRPTAVLPGSGGTVTGIAVNDWLDDDGKPIYGRDEQT